MTSKNSNDSPQFYGQEEAVGLARQLLIDVELAPTDIWNGIENLPLSGKPVLIQRLDLEGAYYYLVFFALENNGNKAEGVVRLNALNEVAENIRYEQSALVPVGSSALFSTENKIANFKAAFESRDITPNRIIDNNEEIDLLVWKPCLKSFSPLLPFHLLESDSGEKIYVRIDGEIFTEEELNTIQYPDEPPIKGQSK